MDNRLSSLKDFCQGFDRFTIKHELTTHGSILSLGAYLLHCAKIHTAQQIGIQHHVRPHIGFSHPENSISEVVISVGA